MSMETEKCEKCVKKVEIIWVFIDFLSSNLMHTVSADTYDVQWPI